MNTSIFKLGFVWTILMLVGCKTPKFSVKETTTFNALNICKTQDNTKNIVIDIKRVYPKQTNATSKVLNEVLRGTGNSANRIDVTGQGFQIIITGIQLKVYVPYYGEQQMGRSNIRNSIYIKNQNYERVRCEFKENEKYTFSIISKDANLESYRFNMEILIGGMARVTILPDNAQSIRYEGTYMLK